MDMQFSKLVKIVAVSLVLSLGTIATSNAFAGCGCSRCSLNDISTDNYSGVAHYRDSNVSDELDQNAVI